MTLGRIAALFGALGVLLVAVVLVFTMPPNATPATPGPSATDVAAASPTPVGSPARPSSGPSSAPSGGPAGSPGSQPTAAPSSSAPPSPANPLAKELPPTSDEPDALTGYVWPLRNALLTSRFAPRDAADGGFMLIDGKAYHDGIDLATRCGDKVRAAHDGTVLYAGRNFDVFFGYQGDASEIYARLERTGRVHTLPIVIVIDDGNGYRSAYVHLQEANVEAGQTVEAGDVIGREGATGFATGCHLHYTMIRMDGEWQQVVERLWRYGYPSQVRERVNPLKVLQWDDEFAPQRLKDKVNPPSPSPSASPIPTTSATP